MGTSAIEIAVARPSDRDAAFAIVDEYCSAIGVTVRDDLATVGEYLKAPGAIWLARDADVTIGCIALRPLPQFERACEVKRLYVREAYRGAGIADALLEALHRHALAARFDWAYLDTKDDLTAAIRFYERNGYERCERYNDNPQATIFMRRCLSASG